MKHLSLWSAAVCLSLCACQPPPIPPMQEAITYRELTAHPRVPGWTVGGPAAA